MKIELYYVGSAIKENILVNSTVCSSGYSKGLKTITDYKGKPSHELPCEVNLPNVLNTFFARFDESNTEPYMREPAVPDDCVISLTVADVSKTFKQVNIHKAAGPDGRGAESMRGPAGKCLH
jgi:hypothetical protein